MCDNTQPSNGLPGHWICISDHAIYPETCYMKFQREDSEVERVLELFLEGMLDGFMVASAIMFWLGIAEGMLDE